MEITKLEIEGIEAAIDEAGAIRELAELELSVVGGGHGDICLG